MENLGFSQKTSGFSLALCSGLGKPLLIMFGFHCCSLLWVSSLECSTIYQHGSFFGLEITNGVIIEKYTVTQLPNPYMPLPFKFRRQLYTNVILIYLFLMGKGSGLFKPVLNPQYTRTNPQYFWENPRSLQKPRVCQTRTEPVLNPYTKPVLTRTFCTGLDG